MDFAGGGDILALDEGGFRANRFRGTRRFRLVPAQEDQIISAQWTLM